MGNQEDTALRCATGPSSCGSSPQAVSPVPASVPSADPIILVRADDPRQKPLLYACGKCGSVHSPAIYLAREEVKHATALEAARDCYNCKTHNTCSHCGAECPKGWTACEPCRYQRKLDAAAEIPDDGGPYCAFDGDTYFTEMEQAVDAGLEWVSPCEITYPKIDAYSVLENLLDEMHEDASIDDMDGVDEFSAAVEVFNKAQRTQSWFGDVKRKIRVPASGIEARSDETLAAQPERQEPVPEATPND